MRLGRVVLVIGVIGSILGLTPAAPASPVLVVSCNYIAMTNVKLGADLPCPGSHGIVVGADGITIDLAGHTLTGDRTAGKNGVDDAASYAATVVNGTLDKFYVGVALTGHGIVVKHVTVMGSSHEGMILNGDDVVVKSATAIGNTNYGIYVGGNYARVTGSRAWGNTGGGIDVNGDFAAISSSQASGNGYDGIDVVGDAPKIGWTSRKRSQRSMENTASGNGYSNGVSDGSGYGIYVDSFTTAPVGRNVAQGNDSNTMQCVPVNLC